MTAQMPNIPPLSLRIIMGLSYYCPIAIIRSFENKALFYFIRSNHFEREYSLSFSADIIRRSKDKNIS